MDSDKLTGVLIIIAVIVLGILYFGSFMLPWSFLTAVKVVVSVAFLGILVIGGWIGWTMASTPSAEPIEDEEFEDFDVDEDIEETDEGETEDSEE